MLLTDNEKAAIAARLWKPGQKCTAPCKPLDGGDEFGDKWCPKCKAAFGCGDHDEVAPDMHDPANLWRALDVLPRYEWTLLALKPAQERAKSLFITLVAFYDEEHPSA